MSFTPSEVVLGATLPLENGSTITFSVAGLNWTKVGLKDRCTYPYGDGCPV